MVNKSSPVSCGLILNYLGYILIYEWSQSILKRKRVNVNICEQVPSFYRNVQIPSFIHMYVAILWLLSYVSSMTRRKKTPWTKCKFELLL